MPRGPRFARPPRRPVIERKLDEDKGRRLGGLASLGPLGAGLFEGNFEVNFSNGFEKLEKKSRAQRRKILSKNNGRQREATTTEPKATTQGPAGDQSNGRQREATGGNDHGAESDDTNTNS